MMTIAKFDRCDLINTPRSDKPSFTIWFSGCTQKCIGCYNYILWDKSKGFSCDVNTILELIFKECERLNINNVVLLGGEPMEQDHNDLLILSNELYKHKYNIWLYTGWDFNEIPDNIKQNLYTIKCGRYDESLKCDGIPSSTNQKFYRINKCNKWEEIYFN